MLAFSFLFFSLNSHGAELINASWSAGTTLAGASTTYTISYQVVTANPVFACYAIFPYGFTCTGTPTITINGTAASLSGSSYISNTICRINLQNTTLVTAGCNIVVTVQVTNGTDPGSQYWTWIRTANGGGNTIDQISSPAPIVIAPPAPAIPVATAATSVTGNDFNANWNLSSDADEYFIDVSDGSSFTNILSTYNNISAGSSQTFSVSALSPVTTYYFRVRASNITATSANSNVISVTTSKADAAVSLSDLAASYDGSQKYATVVTNPPGLYTDVTYDGSSTPPVNAGTYQVIATINDATYQGADTSDLIIAKSIPSLSLGNMLQVYDGTAKQIAVSTIPSTLNVDVTYDNSSTLPVHAGTYSVVATINDLNYEGVDSGTFTISKAQVTLTLDDLAQVYDGTSRFITVNSSVNNLVIDAMYGSTSIAPVNAGTYLITANVVDSNYEGTVSGNLIVSKAPVSLSLDGLSQVYDGTGKFVTIYSSVNNLFIGATYDNSLFSPVHAGSYIVDVTVIDSNYAGHISDTMLIAKAQASVTQVNLLTVYDGTVKHAGAVTVPAGLAVDYLYDGSSIAPVNAGDYEVVATINDQNYEGGSTDNLIISKATATVVAGSLSPVYDGYAKHATATTVPLSLNVYFTYNNSSTAPVNAGTYTVVSTVNDINYEGTSSQTMIISKATARVSMTNLNVVYNGSAQQPVITTTPAGLSVSVLINGSENFPVNPGTYYVVATVYDPNYEGIISGNMNILIPTGINETTLDNINVYPNPASEFIQVISPSKIKSISLINSSGEIVRSKENCEAKETIDVKSLSKGIYIVVIESAEGKISKKIVIK